MTTGELLVALFEAYRNNDDDAFMKAAFTLIEEEKSKNHYVLANKLKKTLAMSPNTSIAKTFTNSLNTTFDLPRDKDKGSTLVEIKYPQKSFEDIILTDNIKQQLEDIILEYRKKHILQGYGFKPKTKILFCGPPGCGKTMCSEILANELDLPILYTRFDGLISSYLGETASNIRKVFDYAGKNNWILFFDEFDVIGKSRDNSDENGELKRVVNSFLQILDNFNSDSFVIAATNHEKMIDSALWRRFDEIIFFDRPNEQQISALIRSKLRAFKVLILDIEKYSKKLIGSSYADVERICTEAIKYCLINGDIALNNQIFEMKLNDELKRAALIKEIGGEK